MSRKTPRSPWRTALALLSLGLSWTLATPAAPTPTDTPPPANDAAMTGGAPPLPAATPPEVTADLRIAELPFLIPLPEEAGPDAASPAPRGAEQPPAADQAAIANPFSALFGPAPDTETPPAVAEPPPVAPPPVAEVSAPPPPPESVVEGPPDLSELIPTPTPRPPLTRPGELPRRLEASATPQTPRPLAWEGADAHAARGGALAEVAALRVPPLEPGTPVTQRPAGLSATAAGATTPLQPPPPLQLAHSREAQAAGNTVQRLLDERGVVFTAMSTGTGVFRTQEHDGPILLAVGEALPGSEVVLVELTPDAAAFAYGERTDVRHRLPLRP
ncbi:hypothetical protein [Truepera radiovictrix]|uniref:Uncharacterized protein n=1 Tax=Truepera radiovictrix (strain DSM 17093 / CIP 108686 / LMG 22925 / RQ-24) TaxID=649638 RepID=D7CWU5_TRURR|nr:hypothetical protein [Truepera radiovictrix]ADI14453.1 hypothetical protein Trad_1331 [Truepera radiovictrix DSM 17093]WMT56990.1 hypothetical protein RCV51_13350 [Truepera radiovictrix]